MKIQDKTLIYLDNNATTPVDNRVLESMMPYLTENFANANSTHQFGVGAYEAVKIARLQVADLIGADSNEIVFTSGATEAINLAIKGIAENYSDKGNHIITVSTEHSAVLDTCRYLKSKGYNVTYLPVQTDGLIDLNEIKKTITNETILISVMFVNNETGVIQPIKQISELAHASEAIFMTDATQAVGKLIVDVDESGIDLLCLNGHKLYAPKGVGALYIRQRNNRINLPAQLHGGGHERGLRSGTLNVPGIVALGKACEIAKIEMNDDHQRIRKLRDYLESELLKINHTSVNGNRGNRMYNISNICFNNADSDAMIMGLSNTENDLPLIAVSNGSACTSASIEPSHVLTAMGLSERDSFCSIRFSLGKFNTMDEMIITVSQVKKIVNELRAMS